MTKRFVIFLSVILLACFAFTPLASQAQVMDKNAEAAYTIETFFYKLVNNHSVDCWNMLTASSQTQCVETVLKYYEAAYRKKGRAMPVSITAEGVRQSFNRGNRTAYDFWQMIGKAYGLIKADDNQKIYEAAQSLHWQVMQRQGNRYRVGLNDNRWYVTSEIWVVDYNDVWLVDLSDYLVKNMAEMEKEDKK